jgi:hypothetical protein
MFRILSIDGGGMKGTFAAAFLDELQATLPSPIANYFDLIAGTSTGGIIAVALGMCVPTSEILALYKNEANTIFARDKLPWFLRRRGSIYRPEGLRLALDARFGDRRLAEAKQRLLIPALEESTGRVHIYKNAYHPRLRTDYRRKVVEIAMATTAAPVYLPAHEADSGLCLLDGGLWANNPAGISVAEAVGLLRIPCDEVRLLSVGTTDSPVRKRPSPWRWIARAKHMLDLSMAGQSSGSLGIAKTLIGAENVFRINLMVAQGIAALDQTEDISVLEGLGRSEGRRGSVRLREAFFTCEAPPFSPIYSIDSSSRPQDPSHPAG